MNTFGRRRKGVVQMREAIGFAAFVVGAAALTAVNHHPTHGRRTARERAAVEAAATQLTHQQIADAWTQATLGNTQPLKDIQGTFPFPVRTVYQEGAGIVLTFVGHQETCIDFVSQPASSIVTAHRC
jgi:hypothetical protein